MTWKFAFRGPIIAGLAMMSFVNFGLAQNNQGTETETAVFIEYAEIILRPPDAPVLAGYLVLWNGKSETVYLKQVDSEAFGNVQLHRTQIIENVARMRPITQPLAVPGKSELVMKRGGIHLMLSKPSGSLIAGQRVILNVALTDGRIIPVEAELKPFGSPPIDHHHG